MDWRLPSGQVQRGLEANVYRISYQVSELTDGAHEHPDDTDPPEGTRVESTRALVLTVGPDGKVAHIK